VVFTARSVQAVVTVASSPVIQCRVSTKYKVHSIDTRTGSVQTAYNSTDTNALSAGADSPGERGACSFFLGIATAQHPLSSLLHLFIAGIARSLSRQVLVV